MANWLLDNECSNILPVIQNNYRISKISFQMLETVS